MSDVTRYRMFHDYIADCHCEIDEHADGEYVSLSDYDALAAERDALREKLRVAVEGIGAAQRSLPDCPNVALAILNNVQATIGKGD